MMRPLLGAPRMFDSSRVKVSLATTSVQTRTPICDSSCESHDSPGATPQRQHGETGAVTMEHAGQISRFLQMPLCQLTSRSVASTSSILRNNFASRQFTKLN